jgi:hypothetical protein
MGSEWSPKEVRPGVNPAWEEHSFFDNLAVLAHQSLFDAEFARAKPRPLSAARGAAFFGVVLLLFTALETLSLPFVASDPAIHIIIGVALIPALVFKLVYSGIGFARYYREGEDSVRYGAPFPLAKAITFALLAATVLLVASGLEMTFGGPTSFSMTFVAPVHFLIAIIWYLLLAMHGYVYWRRSKRSVSLDFGAVINRVHNRQGARGRITLALLSLILGATLAIPVHSEITRWTQAARDAKATPAAPTPITQYSPYSRKLGERRLELKYKIGLENRKNSS